MNENKRIVFLVFTIYILFQVNKIKAGSRDDVSSKLSQLRRCFNPNEQLGACISIDDCPSLKNILENKLVEQYDFLRASICSNTNGKVPIVCCTTQIKFEQKDENHFNRIIFPDELERIKKSSSNTSKVNKLEKIPEEITTTTVRNTTADPKGEELKITTDPLLIWGKVKIPKSKESREISFEKTLSNNKSVIVWDKFTPSNEVGTNTTSKSLESPAESITKSVPEIPIKSKFPKPPQCGGVTVRNKIYGGDDADLNEFSWMAILEYRNETTGEIVLDCAGSIINSRYILTAAHCVLGDIQQLNGKLISVRVGDHNTATEIDCYKNDCQKKYQRIDIESVTSHEDFAFKSSSGTRNRHDIALLRLKRNIDFVRSGLKPACLPNDEMEILTNSTTFMAAGWGHNGLQRRTSVKQKVKLPFVDHKACREIFSKRFFLADEQICAGGRFREDSCNGDSGGPLMRLNGSFWILEGLVSFGVGCGLEQPGIYTNLRYYLEWIDKNVKIE